MKFTLVLFFFFIAFDANKALASNCKEIGTKLPHSFENLERFEGTSLTQFSLKDNFTREEIESLRNIVKSKNALTVRLYKKNKELSENEARALEPFLDYIEKLTKSLNSKLSSPERNLLEVEDIYVVHSNGSFLNITERWHSDTIRYMTGTLNLSGLGTEVLVRDKYKNRLPKEDQFNWKLGKNKKPSGKVISVPVGEGAIFSSAVRDFLLPGSGTQMILHKSPTGRSGSKIYMKKLEKKLGRKYKPIKKNRRLGIVIFWSPKNMNAYDLSTKYLTNDGKNDGSRFVLNYFETIPNREELRRELLKKYFPDYKLVP